MGAIHLIRHGQASWGADDYDQLSALGTEQGAWLGRGWKATEFRPDSAVAGSMKRHRQTATAAFDALGEPDTSDGVRWRTDDRWNEYDHLGLTGHLTAADRPADAREFQRELDSALHQWVAGERRGAEPFSAFRDRVLGGLADAAEQATAGRRVAVFTSGGPIALVASHLLAGDASLFITMNRVVVNGSVTTVMVGRGGSRLLTFNDHAHVPATEVTFR
jgi:broad specificity phosphatase PhoE